MTSHAEPSRSPHTPAPPVPRPQLQEVTSLRQRAPCVGTTADEVLRGQYGIERIETAVRQDRHRNRDHMFRST